MHEQLSFADAAGVEERIRTRFIPFDVFAEKVLLNNPGWSEAREDQDCYAKLDNARVCKRMIHGEECIAVFEGLVVDEVRSHTTEATFSKKRTLQDLAMLGDAQRTAAEWVSEMHAAGHQEGKCVQIREKLAVQPSDVRNVEASSVCGTSAGSADTMRGFARDMARVQALKAEVASLLLEDAEATGQAAAKKR